MQTEDRNLIEVRLTQIEANVGSAGAKKRSGTIQSTVNMQIADGGDERALATVQIVATGVPQGAVEGETAFTISITGMGLWEWAGNIRPKLEELQSERMLYELCSSVHTLVVAEVSRLALALGFPGVALPWSMRSESDVVKDTIKVLKTTKRRRPAALKKSAKETA